MVSVSFSVRNPKAQDLKTSFSVFQDFKLSQFKHLEIQLCRFSLYYWFSFRVDLSWQGQCHAGPMLEIEFWGYQFILKIYDTRHWDYSKGNWEI